MKASKHSYNTKYNTNTINTSPQGARLTAVLGSTTLFSGGVRVQSSQVEMHQNYNHNNLNNDIALITIPYVTYTSELPINTVQT